MEGGPLIISWISIALSYVCVLYFVLLETVLYSIANRIKCHTKIHTESVLLFSFIVVDINHSCFFYMYIILTLQHSFIHKS